MKNKALMAIAAALGMSAIKKMGSKSNKEGMCLPVFMVDCVTWPIRSYASKMPDYLSDVGRDIFYNSLLELLLNILLEKGYIFHLSPAEDAPMLGLTQLMKLCGADPATKKMISEQDNVQGLVYVSHPSYPNALLRVNIYYEEPVDDDAGGLTFFINTVVLVGLKKVDIENDNLNLLSSFGRDSYSLVEVTRPDPSYYAGSRGGKPLGCEDVTYDYWAKGFEREIDTLREKEFEKALEYLSATFSSSVGPQYAEYTFESIGSDFSSDFMVRVIKEAVFCDEDVGDSVTISDIFRSDQKQQHTMKLRDR